MKVALYGINKGLQTLYSLLRDCIYIDAICVENQESAYSVLGKPYIIYSEIKEKRSEWKVVLAPNSEAEDTLARMKKDGINAYIYLGKIDDRLFVSDLAIDSLSICFFLKENKAREIFVFGTDERAIDFVNKMKFLDCEISGFISEERGAEELCGIPIISVFELLIHKNDPMVVISHPSREIVNLLNNLGLKYGRNYCLMSSLRINERRGNRNAVWDLNLGHTYIDIESDPKGFVKYGSNRAKKKIVILGGSTSDSYYTWFASWPEILAFQLHECGYDIQILNGAMCGYNVQQEFFKLVRDVLPLKPDIVIDFSGTNNAGEARVSPEYPFTPYYLLNLSKQLAEGSIKYSKQTDDMAALSDQSKVESIFYGNAIDDTCAESYINTLRMMNAVCREFGIHFVSFFQPNIWTKHEYWDEWEKDIVFCSSVSDLAGDRTDFRLKRAEDYRIEVRKRMSEFQIDLTDLFMKEVDVYMDTDHYTLKANELIAEQVKEYLITSLPLAHSSGGEH